MSEPDEDGWDGVEEVPVRDLNQSGSEDEAQPEPPIETAQLAVATRTAAVSARGGEGWVSEPSDDEAAGGGDSREEEVDAPAVVREGARSRVAVDDETSSLAQDLYRLESRLATAEAVEQLRHDKSLLETQLREALRHVAERDARIAQLRAAQLEILQAMAVLKKNHRAFQQGVREIVETLPPQRAATELQSLIEGLMAQQRALDAAAEQRYMQDDAECLASNEHPVVKLMRLTRNVNPLEASFALVRYFCRLEEGVASAGAPLMALLLDKSLRFWEVTAEFQLYPLYSVIVTHFRSRVQRVGESTPHLLRLLSNFCVLFFIYRSEYDASESTDIVVLRSLQTVLLGGQDDSDMGPSISGPSARLLVGTASTTKLIVKTKRAFWIEMRKLIVLAYAFVIRNEGELVEGCIRATLEHIRREASPGELKYDASDRCSPGMTDMLKHFDVLLARMHEADSPRAVIVQVFGQLCSLINGHCCNSLMLRRSYATMHAAAAFRADLRHLDAWVREKLPADAVDWLLGKLKPISEMINVLFMNKTLLRRPEIRQELCSSLTGAQLCQILSTYEPQKGEEPVSLALLQSLMPQSQPGATRSHQADVSAVLVDVALLDAIDLSVMRDDWVTRLPLRAFKEVPLPDGLYEEFILFREKKANQEREAAAAAASASAASAAAPLPRT